MILNNLRGHGERTAPRLTIDELSATSMDIDALSEEELSLVAGGLRNSCYCTSSKTIELDTGATYPDEDF
ncbi:MAG: hypothetical protein M3R02_03020 [Chloroflexota bacterium]|nr:hypothetical protein [Chloroflexota bacterium]